MRPMSLREEITVILDENSNLNPSVSHKIYVSSGTEGRELSSIRGEGSTKGYILYGSYKGKLHYKGSEFSGNHINSQQLTELCSLGSHQLFPAFSWSLIYKVECGQGHSSRETSGPRQMFSTTSYFPYLYCHCHQSLTNTKQSQGTMYMGTCRMLGLCLLLSLCSSSVDSEVRVPALLLHFWIAKSSLSWRISLQMYKPNDSLLISSHKQGVLSMTLGCRGEGICCI